jgi:hypothetical protein
MLLWREPRSDRGICALTSVVTGLNASNYTKSDALRISQYGVPLLKSFGYRPNGNCTHSFWLKRPARFFIDLGLQEPDAGIEPAISDIPSRCHTIAAYQANGSQVAIPAARSDSNLTQAAPQFAVGWSTSLDGLRSSSAEQPAFRIERLTPSLWSDLNRRNSFLQGMCLTELGRHRRS